MAGFTKTRIVDPSGGGTDTSISGALSNVSNGGTVIVEEYNSTGSGYSISSAMTVPSNVTLIGRGNVLITVTADTNVFTSNGGSRIVISGFRIKADRGGSDNYSSQLIKFQSTKNCVIEKCTLSVVRPTTGSAGIYFLGTDGSTPNYAEGNIITECTISGDGTNNGPVYGILLEQYCYRNMITNNTVDKCNENCAITNTSEHNVIMGNVFKNSNSSGNYGGVYLYNSNYNTIVGNECTDNAKRGIYLRSSSRCAVQGNVCKGNSQEGIRLGGDSSISSLYNGVVDNTCSGNTSTGILLAQYAQYNAVNGNTAPDNSVGIGEDSTNVDYNVIVGNVCHNNASVNIATHGAHTIETGNISS